MIGEVGGGSVCVLCWGAWSYLAARHRSTHWVDGERRWAWKRGTPDWVTRIMPWLGFLGWVGLLVVMASWLLHAVPVAGAAHFHARAQLGGVPALADLLARRVRG